MWQIWVTNMTNMSDNYDKYNNDKYKNDKYDKYEWQIWQIWGVQQPCWEAWGKLITRSDSCHFFDQPIAKIAKSAKRETRSREISNRKDIYSHSERKDILPHRRENTGGKSNQGFSKNILKLLAWTSLTRCCQHSYWNYCPRGCPIVQEISTIVVEPTNTGRAQFLLLWKLKREIGSIKWGGQ